MCGGRYWLGLEKFDTEWLWVKGNITEAIMWPSDKDVNGNNDNDTHAYFTYPDAWNATPKDMLFRTVCETA